MDELVRWLGEQLDEDERIARAATPGPWSETGRDSVGEGMVHSDSTGWAVVGSVKTGHGPDAPYANVSLNAAHIATHDPARVLREIDAKRGIVARYEFACREAAAPDISEEERETRVQVAGALQSCVLCLALPYADRPGFREEWRP